MRQFLSADEFGAFVTSALASDEGHLGPTELTARADELAASRTQLPPDVLADSAYFRLLSEQGQMPPMPGGPKGTRYQEAIEMVLETLLPSAPIQPSMFKKFVCFRAVDSPVINAKVFRSPDGRYFVVTINAALIDMLHKIGKIDAAISDPSTVIYCSRSPGVPRDRGYYEDLRKEYIAHFVETGRAQGPFILLRDSVMAPWVFRLHVMELFIVGHEIGHILDGAFQPEALSDSFFSFLPERAHRREHMADMIGFLCTLMALNKNDEGMKNFQQSMRIFGAVNLLFDYFALIRFDATASHPHPIRRVYCLADHFFGPAITGAVERSYEGGPFDEESLEALSAEFDPFDYGTFFASVHVWAAELWKRHDDATGSSTEKQPILP
jgi:hypothetical protein